jgi:succinate dehydrogenase/fumarate reductase flavoprotein subunit
MLSSLSQTEVGEKVVVIGGGGASLSTPMFVT